VVPLIESTLLFSVTSVKIYDGEQCRIMKLYWVRGGRLHNIHKQFISLLESASSEDVSVSDTTAKKYFFERCLGKYDVRLSSELDIT
jgi:hypothetical protein